MFINLLLLVPLIASLPIQGQEVGQCVMYGECGRGLNCAYDGPAKAVL